MTLPTSEFDEAADPRSDPTSGFSRPVFRVKKGHPIPWLHLADTQRALAIGIVVATLLLYGYLVVAAVCGWITDEAFVRVIAALSPLQALAAATVGFFFGQRETSSH